MILLNRTDKSWLITWASVILVILALVISIASPTIVKAIETPPAFKIVDVRAEQGQLVVEVQHFYPNGNHWFYQLYTWQGREAYKYPKVTNEAGELLLEDGTIAPYRTDGEGEPYQYIGYSRVFFVNEEEGSIITSKVIHIDNAYANLQTDYFGLGSTKNEVLQYQGKPDKESDLVWEYRNGPDWKRHDYPILNETSILQVISNSHKSRLGSNWTGGQGRSVLPNLKHNVKDRTGARDLVVRFEYLAWNIVEAGIDILPPYQQLYDRTYGPKTFTIDGNEYTGDTSNLSPIDEFFEIIDLRTKDTKTYEIGNKVRRTVVSAGLHFQTPEGNWENTSLMFRKVIDEDIWIMNTHPEYQVYGTPSHISMTNLEGDSGGRWYTPGIITYEEDTAWYEYNGLRWTYTLSSSGMKLTSEGLSPRGPKEYPFVFLPLGNTNPLRIDASGNATTSSEYDLGDLGPDGAFFWDDEYAEFTNSNIVVPRTVIIGADGVEYIAGVWEIVDAYTIKFAFDDNSLPPQAFPYVVDPTTILLGYPVGHADAFMYSLSPYDNYNFGTNTGNNTGDGSGVAVATTRSLIKFTDFSAIPTGAIIQDAQLSMELNEAASGFDPFLYSVGAYRLHKNWVESQVTWNNYSSGNAWSSAGASSSSDRELTASGTVTILAEMGPSVGGYGTKIRGGGMTDDVRGFIDGTYNNYGWLLQCDCEQSVAANYSYIKFGSFNGSIKPRLIVTYSYPSIHACQATTETFYPDRHPGTTTVDGHIARGNPTASWSTQRNNNVGSTWNGNYDTSYSKSTFTPRVYSGTSSGNWQNIARAVATFDTSSIPNDALITDAKYGFVAEGKRNMFGYASFHMVATLDNYGTILHQEHYNSFADHNTPNGELAPLMNVALIKDDKTSYNYFILNTNGLAEINKSGISKFGFRMGADFNDVEPTWAYDKWEYVSMVSGENDGDSNQKRPKLIVTYITPCAGLTGTVADTIVSPFYPDANPENYSVDGDSTNSATKRYWKDYLPADGNSSTPSSTFFNVGINATNLTDKYYLLQRGFILFETGTTLPDYSSSCTTNSTGIINPDIGTGSATVDGRVRHYDASGFDWQNMMQSPGNGAVTNDALVGVVVRADSNTNKWDMVDRLLLTFDTSGIPDEAILTSGTFSIMRHSLGTDNFADTLALVPSFPAADNNLSNSDYAVLQNTRLAMDVLISNTANSTYVDFELNTAGLNNINILAGSNGISRFGVKAGLDADFAGFEVGGPPWVSGHATDISFRMSDYGSNKPKLVINYALPCPGIHSAVVELTIMGLSNLLGGDGEMTIVSSSPLSNTFISSLDQNNIGSVAQSWDRPMSDLIADSATPNVWALNERGLLSIDDTGVTKFGIREVHDAYNIEPTWVSGVGVNMTVCSAEETACTGDGRPKLIVTHGDSSIAHVDASNIQAGGETIILTLSGSQWPPTGSSAGEFDGVRQSIIDGISGSHGAGTVNWNEAVTANIPVGNVIRTNSSTVTITLPAAPLYDPATVETITVTINSSTTNPVAVFDIAASGDDVKSWQGTQGSYWPPYCGGENTGDPQLDQNYSYWPAGAGSYSFYQNHLRWDTSSLPDDAVILDASLRMFVDSTYATYDIDKYSIFLEYYDYGTGAINCGDMSISGNPAVYSGSMIPMLPKNDAHSGVRLSALSGLHSNYTWNLKNAAEGDNISLDGSTGIRIHLGHNSFLPGVGDAPTGRNSIMFASYDSAFDEPRLSVTYARGADAGVNISTPVFLVDPIPFNFNSFTPTTQSIGSSFEMSILGIGMPIDPFAGNEDVRLIKAGQLDVICTSKAGGTPGTDTRVDCDVTSAVVGVWDVKVTETTGMNATLPASLTLYEGWSSTVNGGSFSQSGSDYAIFAHDAFPYFTVQAFDEVDKEWDASSSPPTSTPAAAGTDAMFTSDKTRLVVGTAANTNYLWAYVFDPATGIISGTPPNPTSVGSIGVNDFDIGTGDNIVVAATTGGDYIYMYDINNIGALSGFWTSTIATPGGLPGVECNAVDINANATYVAVGCTTTPYLHVWAINNGGAGTPSWGTKVADPGTTPLGVINGVKFSPDGTQIAIAIDTAPYVEVYEFNGGVIGDKATWTGPITTPTGIGYDVDWLKENVTGATNLAVAHAVTPFVTVYPFTTDAAAPGIFGVKLDNPGTLPTGTASSVGFHPNGDTIFVGHALSPYVTAYNFTGVSDDDYRVYRYLANFDTSYLPDDAVITSAVLSIYVNSLTGSGWQILVQDAEDASEPLVVGDYDYNNWTTLVAGAHTPTVGLNEITLSNYSGIKKDATGVTQFIIRHEEDIGNTAPLDGVTETIDIEVGDSTTFPEDCLTSSPVLLRSNSLYNLCNSSNVPRLRVTYTSVTGLTTGDPLLANLEVALLDSHTANADGTHTTTVVAKGPIVFLEVSTSPTTSIYDFDLNRSIVDSVDNWSFLSSSVGSPFPFMKNFTAYNDDGITQTLWYEMNSEPKAQMQDRSGLGHHSSYYSFPTDSTSVESTVGIILSVEGSSVNIGEGAGVPSMADDTSGSDIVFTGTSNTSNEGLPMAGFFDYVEEAGGMPSGILKLMFAMVVTILAGLVAFKSFQSVAATYIAMLMAIVAFTLGMNGIFEWWMLLTFGLTGGIFIFTRRAYV